MVYCLCLCVCEQVNSGTVGVLRVQYTSDMLELLIPAIRDKTLPPKDRLGLQNDLYALVSPMSDACVYVQLRLLDYE